MTPLEPLADDPWQTPPATGPLAGVNVIDMTAVGMGPYCTQTLGDFGACVIKIESNDGDVFRYATPSKHFGMGAPFLQLNRNKKSVVLDLKSEQDRGFIRDLVKTADVLVYNIRPQAMRKLGLDDASLREINPKLIYCGLYGFSESGPYAGRPAFDDIIQAMSGLADLQGRGKGEAPTYVPSILADKVSGLAGVNAILAALYERSKSGLGQAIEVPMFETLVSFNLMEHMGGATFGDSEMGYARALSKFRKPYRTSDGHIGLLPYTTEQWRRFFEVAGRPEIMRDPRFANPDERAKNIGKLYEMLDHITPEKSSDQWLTLLEQADIPAARVNRLEDLQSDPHLKAIEFFKKEDHPTEGEIIITAVPTRFARTPATIRTLAPTLGEHTESVRQGVHTQTLLKPLQAQGDASFSPSNAPSRGDKKKT